MPPTELETHALARCLSRPTNVFFIAPAAIALFVACAAILAVWAVHLHDAVNGKSLTSGMEKEGLYLCLRGWEGARGGRHGNGAHQRPPPEAAQRRQVVLQLPAGCC